MNQADIFNNFAFHSQDYPKDEIEAATWQVYRRMKPEEHRIANDALLAQLADAKDAFQGNTERWKDMLADPQINKLVNVLVILNRGWMARVIDTERHPHPTQLNDMVDELTAEALAGKGSVQSDASGMIGAILQYDYRQYGTKAFTSYLGNAIRHAITRTPKQMKTHKRIHAASAPLDEDSAPDPYIDRRAPAPDRAVTNEELMEVLQKAIRSLDPSRRWVAEFVFERILETGNRPTFEEIAERHDPPLSKEGAAQKTRSTLDRIAQFIETRYPQLGENGINRWPEFRAALAQETGSTVGSRLEGAAR